MDDPESNFAEWELWQPLPGAQFVGEVLYLGTYSKGVQRFRLLDGGRLSLTRTLSTRLWINPDGLQAIDGTIYCLTLNDGVHAIRKGKLTRLRWPLPSLDVTSILKHNHQLLVGTRSGLLLLAPQP